MTTVNYAEVKTGKAAVQTDVRTLLFARYVQRAALPEAPPSLDLADQVAEWPMYGNDTIGDCTCAAAGHMIEAWTGEAGGPVAVVEEQAVLDAYKAVTIGDGAVLLTVLNYWRKTGIGGHTVGAFAKIPTFDQAVVKVAAFIFGGLYLGVQLPESARAQIDANQPWDWNGNLVGDNEPGCWGGPGHGGHAVNVVQYDAEGVTVVTWGRLQKMTWAFWERYCDEAYCLISQDYLTGGRLTPGGFDIDTLKADLALVEG
jgi:hypothetical protein